MIMIKISNDQVHRGFFGYIFASLNMIKNIDNKLQL